MSETFQYPINQFSIISDFQLPCDRLEGWCGLEERPKLRVRNSRGSLERFDNLVPLRQSCAGSIPSHAIRSYVVSHGVLICAGYEFKMYVSRDEHEILVDVDLTNVYNAADARIHTTGLGTSIRTLFTGGTPLHAAAVHLDDYLVGFIAPSGVGKTSLLMQLLKDGARFVSDDVVTAHAEGNEIVVSPATSLRAKVTKATLMAGDVDMSRCEEIFPGDKKYWVSISESQRFCEKSHLGALFVLEPTIESNGSKEVEAKRIYGSEAAKAVFQNIHGLWSIFGLLDLQAVLWRIEEISVKVPMFAVRYTRDFDRIHEVIDKIKRTLAEVLG